MKKIIMIFLLLSFTVFAQTANEIVEIMKEKIKVDGMESIMSLVIYDGKGRSKVRKIASVSKLYDNGDTNKSLMRFLEPKDVKGTGFMTFSYDSEKDNDQWLYLPSLRKVRRIVSSEKGNSFMGSEFTYSDIAGLKTDDFNFNILGEETVGSELCWKIEQLPINENIEEDYDFFKRIIFIAKSDNLMKKVLYYNFDEEVYKELKVLKTELIDPEKGKYRMTHMVMDNLENGRKSEMIMEKVVLNRDVKDEYFSFRFLKRE